VTFIGEQDRKVFKDIMKSTNQKVSNRVIPPKVRPLQRPTTPIAATQPVRQRFRLQC
jgi:hypothetical protein